MQISLLRFVRAVGSLDSLAFQFVFLLQFGLDYYRIFHSLQIPIVSKE